MPNKEGEAKASPFLFGKGIGLEPIFMQVSGGHLLQIKMQTNLLAVSIHIVMVTKVRFLCGRAMPAPTIKNAGR